MTETKLDIPYPGEQMDTDFKSLTDELHGWFDKPLAELPEALRHRAETDLFPLPWDELSPDQRQIAAEQWDYQHDPNTENDRQDWWDFFIRKDEIEQELAEWESVEAPTAGDLALKKAKIAELRHILTDMSREEQQAVENHLLSQNQSSESATTIDTGNTKEVAKRQTLTDCLRNPPAKQDDWFKAISDMTAEFVAENGRCPNRTEAWSRLCNNPPSAYGITTCKDRGEASLLMNDKTLGRRAFADRWSRYTLNKPQ